jgi:small-conductance mechanosensitive channel
MKTELTANQLSGCAIGALFFAGFGALWFVLALHVRERLTAGAVAGIALVAVGLVLAALHLMRTAKHWPRVADDPAQGRAFAWINAVQWIAAFAVAFVLGKLGLAEYILSAIAAIVGLHFFPLARLFRYPLHYATGALLVMWAAGTAALVPAERLQGTTAVGVGAILWLSGAVTLVLAIGAARRPAQGRTQTV